MPPLKSLEREYPIIDSNFRQFCASHGIFSVEEFLIHDVYMLVAFTEQHSNSERLKQGITEVLSIIDGQHQQWCNGLELLEEAQQNKIILPIGCERIDMLLQGGLRGGHLVELVGPSSSGKTQICLQAAANAAKNYLGNVIFFDTGNSFSPKRVAQIVCQISDPAEIETNKILQQVMNNIVCRSVFDIFTLLNELHQLKSNLKSQTGCQVRILIVDSISSLITPILGSGAHGHALMVSVGFLLKEIAYEHNLSVLMTNHMVAGEGGHLKPALGDSWKNIPHVRLHLSRDHESNTFSMSILRHPYIRIVTLIFLAIAITSTTSARILEDETPPATATAPPAAATGAAAVTPATGSAAVTPGSHDHPLTFFMHDILGGSNPSARAVTGIVTNPAVNGQVPFAKPNGAVLPTNDANSALINNNNIPFLTGLGGSTSNVIQNNGNSGNSGFPLFNGAQLPAGAALQKLMFGTMTVIDDELTEGHELGSGLIGKAQGFYVSSSVDGTSQTMAFTVMFENGNYADSLSLFGVHRSAVSQSQIAVMGGTGKYLNAKGYATVKTFPGGNQHNTDGVETLLQITVYLAY